MLTFISCHIFNFVVLAAEDADFGVMDLLLKPLKLWIRAVRELPKRLWVSNTAASSVDSRRDVDPGDRRNSVRAVLGLGF